MPLKKASLIPVSGEKAEPIQFMFNPTQLSFSRTANWNDIQGSRGDNDVLATTDFTGVTPYNLKISKIIFDTYETKENVEEKYLNKLKQSVIPTDHTDKVYQPPGGASKSGGKRSETKNRKRPPVYSFMWGDYMVEFRCVVNTLSYNLTMFLPDGKPVRAEVNLTLKEVDKDKEIQSGTPQPSKDQRKNSNPRKPKPGS